MSESGSSVVGYEANDTNAWVKKSCWRTNIGWL